MEIYRHPNIVHLFGAVHDPEHLAIVLELFPLGNLKSLMKKRREEGKPMQLKYKIKSAINVSTAMSFLHSNGVIHRDLKTGNLLVVTTNPDCPIVVKLADFGTVRWKGTSKEARKTRGIGTPIYVCTLLLFISFLFTFSLLLKYPLDQP